MIRIELSCETIEELHTYVTMLQTVVFRPSRMSSSNGRPPNPTNHRRRYNDDEVLKMLSRADEIGLNAAADEAGVTSAWLSRIRHGHIWKHLGLAAVSE